MRCGIRCGYWLPRIEPPQWPEVRVDFSAQCSGFAHLQRPCTVSGARSAVADGLACAFPSSSPGVSKIAPPPTYTPRVRSRVDGPPPFGQEMPVSQRLPPLSFLSTSTVCSALRAAGLLHPAAGPGVHAVSANRFMKASMRSIIRPAREQSEQRYNAASIHPRPTRFPGRAPPFGVFPSSAGPETSPPQTAFPSFPLSDALDGGCIPPSPVRPPGRDLKALLH